jgi:membrane fusion protein (multidrug efflux system)
VKQAAAEAQAAQSLVERARAQWVRHEAEAQRMKALRQAQLKAVSLSELDGRWRRATVPGPGCRRSSTWPGPRGPRAVPSALPAPRRRPEAGAGGPIARRAIAAATLTAPVSGRVGRKSVEVGARVQPGQQLLAIVQDEVWVVANYKEIQLRDLHAGQRVRVRVRVDAFPGREFTGTVDSVSPASGAQFSLLPPDNATGNFTKIVQRIPVKVVPNPQDLKAMRGRLTPGMSAIVEIDLRQGNPAAAASSL